MDDGGPGGVLPLLELVNEQVVDACLLKGDGEGGACRPCPYDENVRVGCKHCLTPFVNSC